MAIPYPGGARMARGDWRAGRVSGRVEFHFRATVLLVADYELRKPYREEALEIGKVVEDRRRLIVLQHLLLADDGLKVQVVKHGGQIWIVQELRLSLNSVNLIELARLVRMVGQRQTRTLFR